MSTIESYDKEVIPQVMMGTGGTSGDLARLSTGSAMTYKSYATGTAGAATFVGILIDSADAGSNAAILSDGCVNLLKHSATQKIEVGNKIYGTKSSNRVGTLAKGTALGVCFKQSATTDDYVVTKLLPFDICGAGGFHA